MSFRKHVILVTCLITASFFAAVIGPPAYAQKSKKAMTKAQVIELLENGVSSTRVEELVRAYGITFTLDPETVTQLRDAGANESLIKALRELSAKPEEAPPPVETKPAPAAAPAAPPAAAPAPPVLMVETTPPGTEVYVDEERVGKTGPEGKLKVSTLPAGNHRIRVSSSGYDDFARDMDLTAGQTTVVAVTLAAVKPPVVEKVESPPPAAAQPPAAAAQPQSSADFYKVMLGAMGGQEGAGDPELKRFYVTHEHSKGLRAIGYGGGMCYGWLIIGKGRVQFSSNNEGDAFDAAASEISDLEVKSNHVHLKYKGKNYHLMTQDMGGFGGASSGPGGLRKAFESVGVKPK